MISSGLDWSGSPGHEPHDPLLVFAVAHIQRDDLLALASELALAKKKLGLPDTYVFRHVGASAATRRAFYDALARAPIDAHIHVIEKARWTTGYLKRSSGPDRICDGIVEVVLGCPDLLVAQQKLLIDLRRKDMQFVRGVRLALRRALAGIGRETFENVQPCPDHRIEGGIVQVADMIAGEVREQGRIGGPYLTAIRSRMHLV